MDTRARLVAAAAALIAEGGQAAMTLRAIGLRAGVSHNAPYKHFRSRRHLLAAVAAVELERLAAEYQRSSGATPLERARAMAHVIVRTAVNRPELYLLTYGIELQGIDSPELTVAATRAYATLLQAIDDARRSGELRGEDTERLAALIRATAHGAAYLARNGHLAPDGKGKATPDAIVDDLFAYLAAPAGQGCVSS